jgi:small-conductance mechanosensitive channel
MEVHGVKLIGIDPQTGEKLLFSLVLLAAVLLARLLLTSISAVALARWEQHKVRFWTRQGIGIVTTVLLILGLLSIWFDKPGTLATAAGLFTAGLAFALQRVVTAAAGYLVILRGQTFNVGDRISMGGVRGDVIALGFIQTTIMEMGEPPVVAGSATENWVMGRQFTGRIVSVSNAMLFDQPVYNYSRDFPLIWEEMDIPIAYDADRDRAEAILLQAATTFTQPLIEDGQAAIQEMMRRYAMERAELEPRVFYRITDNWLEMGLRFVAPAHGARGLKDQMSRAILSEFDKAGIGIASATYDIVGMPPIRIENAVQRNEARNQQP